MRMRKDKQDNHKKLCDLILAATLTEGQASGGYSWVLRPLAQWAADLGVSAKTISRLIAVPPIWSMQCLVTDEETGWRVRAVALRVGDPPERTPDLVAGIMSKMFRKRTGVAKITPAEFGCLVGLAEAWPAGHQEKIFADALINWPDTAKAIKLHPAYADPVEGKPERYWAFPSIRLMRPFADAVADAYLTRLQAAGKPVPFPYSAK